MYESEFNGAFLIRFCSVAVVENNGTRDWHLFVFFVVLVYLFTHINADG